ncbi:class I SAM-dependent methyltransferase [Phyllobacterium endophyticum]|uniref:Uncharacterized protein n=1 Tax=Phyllobacterium endophyticum TaxID=1149773 RepID=A0A2P7AV48_9HYPH|nr:class I SAM-dependent methyltransferase [Phyllobacterium endophyticum]MBB3234626.1 hypothetical protein [Phyllobacterium endophyticum]PSH58092.1 hypothetical protein CU100_10605 [Phyllobacterium endophyticum]TYR38766.1 hypothetical protein FY050_22550 [Phyllobacterium endophyticum]
MKFAAALASPDHFTTPGPWVGHIPFAHWVIYSLKPQSLVELGTYRGNSYMNFCQSILANNVPTRAYAVDTWKGDEHSGYYGNEIFLELKKKHDPLYGSFSQLLQMSFDEARPRFQNGSIDLLHIDGLHTYDEVKHDFENWLPAMSNRGVVMFHDTDVYQGSFGVHRLWDEVSKNYKSFRFNHSNGLGVLLVGEKCPNELVELADHKDSNPNWREAHRFFTAVGASLEWRAVAEQNAHTSVARELELQKQIDSNEIEFENTLRESREQINQLKKRLVQKEFEVREYSAKAYAAEAVVQELASVRSSTSWKITKPVRTVGTYLRKFKTAVRLLATGDLESLRQRLRVRAAKPPIPGNAVRHWQVERDRIVSTPRLAAATHIMIIATEHTMYVAHLMTKALRRANIIVSITNSMPQEFESDFYIVICPQMFSTQPPQEKRIAVQMEQSVSSRWFTPEYLSLLENSLCVFDYSSKNLEFLATKNIAYPLTYYVPVGAFPDYGNWLISSEKWEEIAADEQCDVLFYGDVNSERRRLMLSALQQKFKVRIVGNMFGASLYRAIRGAKVIVNIHYYEGALLETTRIYECLSLGARVISEVGSDQDDHGSLQTLVSFVPIGNMDAMVQAVAKELQRPQLEFSSKLTDSNNQFEFMLFRATYGVGIIDYKTFETLTMSFKSTGAKIALSLPETVERRQYFQSQKRDDVVIFDGVRKRPGWIGAAYSYKYLATQVLRSRMDQVVIYEDDAEFYVDHDEKMAKITRFLDENSGAWDVFSGFISDLHANAHILDVIDNDGVTYVVLDKMVSMVFNIYNRKTLELISRWEDSDRNIMNNSIDRYLEKSDLTTVTTLPFLVGHHENFASSIWPVHNRDMREMISKSERLLAEKVRDFRTRRRIDAENNGLVSPQATSRQLEVSA